ncbi:hypothetical protein PUN28_011749 [Cardiocondyla obscurior]|uniref:Uncharacterized protein n=1 Tax=Cardiocondyla obscurior TaxID=286306 RepID=A0AAW2FFE3_9HYME
MEIQKRTGEGKSARLLTNILRGGAGSGRASGIGRATLRACLIAPNTYTTVCERWSVIAIAIIIPFSNLILIIDTLRYFFVILHENL